MRKKQRTLDIASAMMELLDYPLSETTEHLPSLPSQIDEDRLIRAMQLARKTFPDYLKQAYSF